MAPGGPADKKNNVLPLWGNEKTMNLNNLILTNILSSPYFKVNLYKLKTYHEVVDEIYYNVQHLEPWEKGSRKTSGQTGMCGGVRGVGAGGIVSTAFCILYKLFTLKLTRKQLVGLMNHCDSPYIRALGFMYIRFTQPPADLVDWYEPYLDDDERWLQGHLRGVCAMHPYSLYVVPGWLRPHTHTCLALEIGTFQSMYCFHTCLSHEPSCPKCPEAPTHGASPSCREPPRDSSWDRERQRIRRSRSRERHREHHHRSRSPRDVRLYRSHDRPRDEREREERSRDDRPRDERPRDERLRDDRSRDDRSRDDKSRDDRSRDDRSRDDRSRDDRSRDDRSRDDRSRDDRSRSDRSRDDRARDDRLRDEKSRESERRKESGSYRYRSSPEHSKHGDRPREHSSSHDHRTSSRKERSYSPAARNHHK
ncbi:uncharacterized protein LOC144114617 [Amblyomma americanum]